MPQRLKGNRGRGEECDAETRGRGDVEIRGDGESERGREREGERARGGESERGRGGEREKGRNDLTLDIGHLTFGIYSL